MSTSAERMRRLRARKAAALEPAPGARLRDAEDLLAPAVAETLASLQLGERDAGAAALALQYARVIDAAADQSWALRWIGPLLLRSLESLGATPAARVAAVKPAGPARASRLEQLRAARPAGKRPSRA